MLKKQLKSYPMLFPRSSTQGCGAVVKNRVGVGLIRPLAIRHFFHRQERKAHGMPVIDPAME